MRWLAIICAILLLPGLAVAKKKPHPLAPAMSKKAKPTPEQRVNRLWRRAGRYYGGGPTPRVRFGKVPSPGQAHAITELPRDGTPPTIHVGRGTTKRLRSRDPFKRRAARRVMLWEFGRTIQGDRGNPWLMHKTNSVSRRLNKQQAQRLKIKRSKKPGVVPRGGMRSRP